MLDKNILLDNVRTLYNKVLLYRNQLDKPKNISLIASLYMINYNEQGFTNINKGKLIITFAVMLIKISLVIIH